MLYDIRELVSCVARPVAKGLTRDGAADHVMGRSAQLLFIDPYSSFSQCHLTWSPFSTVNINSQRLVRKYYFFQTQRPIIRIMSSSKNSMFYSYSMVTILIV